MARKTLLLLFFLPLMGGCATYQYEVGEARRQFSLGEPARAAEIIEKKAQAAGKDQLVYLLDYGLLLHSSGQFKESNEALLKADELVDFKDYVSLSKETASLVLNQEMVQYKGEPYEKVLINAYLALNFLMLGDLEAAAVEARRLNQRLELLTAETGKEREEGLFARYLSAMIWEAEKNWDSAYIDYLKTYEIDPDFPLLQQDLIRLAAKAKRTEDLKKWKSKWPEAAQNQKTTDQGELIIIFQQGWIPRKRPRYDSPRLPELRSVYSATQSAEVLIDEETKGETQILLDVGQLARRTLEEMYGKLIAKRVAGVATKAVVAHQLGKDNKAVGDLAWIIMNAADRADVRHWSTLPESFQIFRVPLAAGNYQIQIRGRNGAGNYSGEDRSPIPVEIQSGKMTFLTWRSLR